MPSESASHEVPPVSHLKLSHAVEESYGYSTPGGLARVRIPIAISGTVFGHIRAFDTIPWDDLSLHFTAADENHFDPLSFVASRHERYGADQYGEAKINGD